MGRSSIKENSLVLKLQARNCLDGCTGLAFSWIFVKQVNLGYIKDYFPWIHKILFSWMFVKQVNLGYVKDYFPWIHKGLFSWMFVKQVNLGYIKDYKRQQAKFLAAAEQHLGPQQSWFGDEDDLPAKTIFQGALCGLFC